ncbi:MAG: hypothetical protein PHN56_06850, partial [Candidatus Nanoarchaeia archaeon]|nr:hypothetical protein [Candidatus Nanoarchaeia archaeon]
TFHAPVYEVDYYNNEKSNEVISKLKKLYNSLNCKNITFHATSKMNYDYLINNFKDYNISIENPAPKEKGKIIFRKFLKKGLNLTLDVCHAIEYSKKELEDLLKNEKIVEIHWSYSHKFRHDSAALKIDENVKYMLNEIKKLNVPIIIEVSLRPEGKNKKIISNEIKLLKSIEK